MKTWIKLYTEINHDPTMGSLTWAQRGIWSALLALAGEIDDRDVDESETGALDTLDNIAWRIRCETHELAEALDAFEKRNMVEEQDGIYFLCNYGKRQSRPPSAKPSAVAGRVKRHRAVAKRECNEDVTSPQRGVTPSDTDTDTDKIQNDAAQAPQQPQAHHHQSSDLADRNVAEVMTAWEQLSPRRQLSPLDAEVLGDLCDDYGPAEVLKAIQACHEYDKPVLAYLKRVLANRHSAPPRASPIPALDRSKPILYRDQFTGKIMRIEPKKERAS